MLSGYKRQDYEAAALHWEAYCCIAQWCINRASSSFRLEPGGLWVAVPGRLTDGAFTSQDAVIVPAREAEMRYYAGPVPVVHWSAG